MILTDTILALLNPPAPITGEFNHVKGTATLQELVYFGAGWPGLDMFGQGIETRNGWTNAVVHRTETADYALTSGFYAGTVERVDATGKVTDVVLAFQGMQVDATVIAAVPSVMLGLPSDHFQRGINMFDEIMHDPRYADAKIHVTGYSMGTVNASWILAHSLKTYGETITDQRVDFTSFAPARYHDEAFKYYGIDPSELEGRWINYQAANDENRHTDFFGTEVILPTLNTETGATDVHQWDHLTIALGLPDWLTSAEQHNVFQSAGVVSAEGYTAPGMANLRIEGDDAGTTLRGLGNDDVIIGGLGRDIMYGGGGNDVFAFESYLDSGQDGQTADMIMDWSAGDKIDLSGIDAIQAANVWGQNPNDAFTFKGSSMYTGAGQVSVFQANNNTYVLLNTDTDNVPEMAIALAGKHTLTAADFIL